MASWNDVTEGSQLIQCPVCLCSVAKKKRLTHSLDCYRNNKAKMEELGVIQCPLSEQHILPIIFLDHHLDGNCQEAMNLLRKFYQKEGLLKKFRGAPPDYDSGIPERYLSKHNRDLLYLLAEDMFGQFMRDLSRNNPDEQADEQDGAGRPSRVTPENDQFRPSEWPAGEASQ